MAIDFAMMPPEVNSALMYSGPGAGPMLAAAAAWDGVAAELTTTAVSCESAVANLAAEAWEGPAAATMTASATQYVAWLHHVAGQAAQAAAQAKGAATAYEAAFVGTVPPAVVAANRALLMSLVATNILGQNAPAIAATQAEYAQMWAQDAAAMYAYSAASATATELTPFTPTEQVATPLDHTGQVAAAAAQAVGAGSQDALGKSMSAVPQTLQGLAAPLAAAPAEEIVDGAVTQVATSSALSGLSAASVYHGAIGSANFFQRTATQVANQFGTSKEGPTTTDIMERVNRIALATGAIDPDELEQLDAGKAPGLGGFGSWQNWLKWLKALGSHVFHASAVADAGNAPAVAGLSVPQAWVASAPEIQLAGAELPHLGAAAAPAATATATDGGGHLYAQGALAAMAGRALAGTAVGRAAAERTASARGPGHSAPPPSDSTARMREFAELLRELGRLRDAGLLSDEEFSEQKQRLVSLHRAPVQS